ncbi:DnaB-like helicase N-terminal domain-containing protein [Microbacterium sp. NPDC080220]|uniref:DnaB-like helicase N-terminal domain-containing protein n=1 Tax=Microbacterium sp. NPDC080220 TaxID=3161017 RepID=UPI003421E246
MTENEQSVTAEQSVLGAMMISSKAAAEVLTLLRTEDFAVPRHAVIFDAIAALSTSQAPTDAVAVADQLMKVGELQASGGAAYVHHLTSVTPTAANVTYYASIVRTDSTRRGLKVIGEQLTAEISDPGVALAKAMNAMQDLRDQTLQEGDSQVRYLAEVLDVPEEEDVPEWVIPGVVERRDRLALTAGEGAGKSTLLRQMAILSAAGIHPFRFSPIDPVRVLVVDAENSERQWRRKTRHMADRAEMLGQRSPVDHVALRCVDLMDITSAGDLGRIHKWMDEVQPDLVVIGPLYRMVPGGLNGDEEAQAALRALDTIRARNVAMLIELHAGHAKEKDGERNLRPRGSSQLLGWPEFGIGLTREKEIVNGRSRYRFIRWRGDRDDRVWPHLVRGQEWPWETTA